MTRLQKVQNSSARLVTGTHKREHITTVLNSLHWLPVIYRSQYNILMYTFKALQGTAPQYLEELVIPYQPTRSLWSESGEFLVVPTTHGVTYGNRCFRKVVATLWNNLQVTTRKCKTLDTFIKTNLFVSVFLAEHIMYLAGNNYVFLKM